jgi:hypothetical protein
VGGAQVGTGTAVVVGVGPGWGWLRVVEVVLRGRAFVVVVVVGTEGDEVVVVESTVDADVAKGTAGEAVSAAVEGAGVAERPEAETSRGCSPVHPTRAVNAKADPRRRRAARRVFTMTCSAPPCTNLLGGAQPRGRRGPLCGRRYSGGP